MKNKIILYAALLSIGAVSCNKEGCTDPIAGNYSKKAKVDDGTCSYPEGVITLEITEDISTSTIIADQTVSICGDIRVTSNLTIEAGAILVMCAGSSITIEPTGSITAIGTAAKPILIKGDSEVKGFWQGLAIESNNPNNKMSYVTIKDAGTYWAWEDANLFLQSGSSLEISNSEISNSSDVGMFVSESVTLSNFANNTFSNNTTGLSIHVKNLHQIDAASNYNNGNANDFIFVRSGTITTDVTWVATTTPYLMKGVYVESGLTVNPGATFLMEADSYFQIEATGFLKANGTSVNMINIIGRYTTAGYWDGLKITSTNPNNQLSYVNVSDGGSYWAYSYSNIDLDGSLLLDNCTISNANSWGLNVSSSASVTSGGLVQTDAAGVESNNTFTTNGSGPDANCTSGCGVNFE
jgi:hypothetical protein